MQWTFYIFSIARASEQKIFCFNSKPQNSRPSAHASTTSIRVNCWYITFLRKLRCSALFQLIVCHKLFHSVQGNRQNAKKKHHSCNVNLPPHEKSIFEHLFTTALKILFFFLRFTPFSYYLRSLTNEHTTCIPAEDEGRWSSCGKSVCETDCEALVEGASICIGDDAVSQRGLESTVELHTSFTCSRLSPAA